MITRKNNNFQITQCLIFIFLDFSLKKSIGNLLQVGDNTYDALNSYLDLCNSK